MSPTVILITGANSGVGYATSLVIANASADYHVIMAGRNEAKLEAARTQIETLGTIKGTLSTLILDVTSEDSIKSAAAWVEDKFGKLDVLINNAAVGSRDLRACMEANVWGPWFIAKTFRPLLFKSDSPYSIYVSSVVGLLGPAADPKSPFYKGPPEAAGYRSSKSALNMVMVEEFKDFKDTKLKSIAVCPGFVVSNLRGESEEARTGGGTAGDPMVSGQTILGIVQGKRDADLGCLVHKDGVYSW
ncbi:hypothetical protein B0A52_07875 [Exophiala mesophila]|uniref:Short chain dehydrogenase n=1 Tax=Exophiala mesophila TaxID=212818 RepID=A0A438MVG8_EXOME|nr:hypothetical protein B0A52_07875 [Exophiala mesophila]